RPRWSADGKSIDFLLEDDRAVHLARVPAGGGAVERVVAGRRVIDGYDLGTGGRIAVLGGTPQDSHEVFAVQGTGGDLRPLPRQNRDLLARLRLAPVEEVSFKSK